MRKMGWVGLLMLLGMPVVADDTAPLNPTGADTADTADASAAPAPSPAAKAPRFCIKCGAPLKPGAKFCTKCGHRIGERLK